MSYMTTYAHKIREKSLGILTPRTRSGLRSLQKRLARDCSLALLLLHNGQFGRHSLTKISHSVKAHSGHQKLTETRNDERKTNTD